LSLLLIFCLFEPSISSRLFRILCLVRICNFLTKLIDKSICEDRIDSKITPINDTELIKRIFIPFFCSSPILVITKYENELYADEMTYVPVCWTVIEPFWSRAFFVSSITIFFFLPLLTLAILYITIAKHLMANPGIAAPNSNTSALRYRRQVSSRVRRIVFFFFIHIRNIKYYFWTI